MAEMSPGLLAFDLVSQSIKWISLNMTSGGLIHVDVHVKLHGVWVSQSF